MIVKPELGAPGWGVVLNDALDQLDVDSAARAAAAQAAAIDTAAVDAATRAAAAQAAAIAAAAADATAKAAAAQAAAVPTGILIPATRFIATGGAPTLSHRVHWQCWLLDPGTVEEIACLTGRGEIPPSWTTMHVDVWWMATAAGAGNVLLNATRAARGDGDAVTVDLSSETAGAANGNNVLVRQRVTSDVAIPPDTDPLLAIRVHRNATGAGDTYAADAAVVGVRLTKGS